MLFTLFLTSKSNKFKLVKLTIFPNLNGKISKNIITQKSNKTTSKFG